MEIASDVWTSIIRLLPVDDHLFQLRRTSKTWKSMIENLPEVKDANTGNLQLVLKLSF